MLWNILQRLLLLRVLRKKGSAWSVRFALRASIKQSRLVALRSVVALRQMRIYMYRACRGGRHLQRYVSIVEHHK